MKGLAILVAIDSPDESERIKRLVEGETDHTFIFARTAEEALRRGTAFRFDALILAWILRDMTGLALINRIRMNKEYEGAPILLLMQAAGPEELRLFDTWPFTTFLSSPYTKSALLEAVKSLSKEREWFKKYEQLIDAAGALGDGDSRHMLELLRVPMRRAPNPVPLGLLIADAALTHGDEIVAEEVLRLLVNTTGSMTAQLRLGKLLYKKGNRREAMSLFRTAHAACPKHVESLCLLGNAQLENEELDAASSSFQKVIEIDPANPVGRAGIVATKERRLQAMMPPSSRTMTQTLASVLNAGGIGLVRQGDYARGIEQYEAAFALNLSEDLRCRLAFNIGLAFVRWGNSDMAQRWLNISCQLSKDAFAKAQSLLNSIVNEKIRQETEAPTKSTDVDDMDSLLFEKI